jgi:hypothetical protein
MSRLLPEVKKKILFTMCLVSACHPGVGVKPSPLAQTSPAGDCPPSAASVETEARAEGLSLKLEQVQSSTDVIVKMTLANATSDRSFWIDSRPSFGDADLCSRLCCRADEVEIKITDFHHRLLRGTCSDLRAGNKPTDFKVLRAGESAEFIHRLAPGCYKLVPGETLWVGATYMSRDNWPGAEEGAYLPKTPVWSGRQKIIVPQGWKDTLPLDE